MPATFIRPGFSGGNTFFSYISIAQKNVDQLAPGLSTRFFDSMSKVKALMLFARREKVFSRPGAKTPRADAFFEFFLCAFAPLREKISSGRN